MHQKPGLPNTLFPLLLVLYELAIYLSNDAYLPALPRITNDLSTTHHPVQLTLTVWFLGSASMQLVLGPISDRYGRKPILLMGGIVFVTTTLVCAQTTNIMTLLFARFFQGSTIASMSVAGYAAVHELYDQKRAIHVLAWMSSISVLAPSLGPLLGATILHILGWRWIFGILAIWASILLFLLFFKMPETNPDGKNKHPIHITNTIKQYGRLLLNRSFISATLAFCFLFGAMIAWIAAGPFLVINEFHYSTFVFSGIQTLVFGHFILGNRLVKPLMRRFSNTLLIKLGLIMALSGGIASIILASFFPHSLVSMVILMVLIAFGSGLCFPILNRVAVESSNEPMGVRIALLASFMGILGMLGSALISGVYNGTLFSLASILLSFSVIAFGFYCFNS